MDVWAIVAESEVVAVVRYTIDLRSVSSSAYNNNYKIDSASLNPTVIRHRMPEYRTPKVRRRSRTNDCRSNVQNEDYTPLMDVNRLLDTRGR